MTYWDTVSWSKTANDIEMFDFLTLDKRKSDIKRYIFAGVFAIKGKNRRKEKRIMLVFDVQNQKALMKFTTCDLRESKEMKQCEKKHKKLIDE